ncbi:conserved hypothetical protein [Talaromyces stipitatus ATCC 10500]|uniref:DUF221 domain protein n=1 Tax=Talaromyces stipitatus (strain ATCC 10500 / CBS 375.48 / QM 6759 / NRRL 1006) TaxID=441959 RepID=B8LX86_TALSN|nr:uncharacterized protein TSTA_062240 [Talaromyces stipitatus ATCC 10500]EED22736.1 conserved hypothetical protein [Talaromyces stipitatus ATCC 10500]
MSLSQFNTGKAQESQGLSVQSFLSSSAIYATICVILVVYELKSSRSSNFPSLVAFLRWPRDSRSLIAQYGPDKYFLIRFFHTVIKIFLPLSIGLTASLFPIDITARHSAAVTGLDRLSWANLESGQAGRLWGNAVAATFSMSYICYVLVGEFHDLISIRQDYLRRVSASSTAVLVTDIPRERLSEDSLREDYARFDGGPTEVWIHKEYGQILNTLLQQRSRLMRQLEIHLTKKFYNREAAARTVEKDEKLKSIATEYQKLNEQIKDQMKDPNNASYRPSALVRFRDSIAPHLVQQVVQSPQIMRMIPHPIQSTNDIILPNLSLSWKRRLVQRLMVEAIVVVFCIFVSVPVGLTGALSQISYLADQIPWVAHLMSSLEGSRWLAIIQGLLPQIFLSVLITFSPQLILIAVSYQRHVTYSEKEMSIAGYYFFFLYIQIFLVVSLASGLTTVIPNVLRYPGSVPGILADNIPKSSNYFYSYLVLQCITQCSLSLRRLPYVVWYWLSSHLIQWTSRTPREIWKMQEISVHWGLVYPVTGAVETGGLLYWRALHQLFIGMYTAELTQLGLFTLRDAKLQAMLMLLTGLMTAIAQWFLSRIYGPLLRHLPAGLISSRNESKQDTNSDPWMASILIEQPIWAPAPDAIRHELLTRFGIYVSQEGMECYSDRIDPVRGPPQTIAARRTRTTLSNPTE